MGVYTPRPPDNGRYSIEAYRYHVLSWLQADTVNEALETAMQQWEQGQCYPTAIYAPSGRVLVGIRGLQRFFEFRLRSA